MDVENNNHKNVAATPVAATAKKESLFKEKLDDERAMADVETWLEFKRISPIVREQQIENIELIKSYIKYGVLTLNQDHTITHKLLFPLESPSGETVLSELTYQARVSIEKINLKMKGYGLKDLNGRMLGYVYAITGQPQNMLNKLDTEDLKIAQAISAFFT